MAATLRDRLVNLRDLLMRRDVSDQQKKQEIERVSVELLPESPRKKELENNAVAAVVGRKMASELSATLHNKPQLQRSSRPKSTSSQRIRDLDDSMSDDALFLNNIRDLLNKMRQNSASLQETIASGSSDIQTGITAALQRVHQIGQSLQVLGRQLSATQLGADIRNVFANTASIIPVPKEVDSAAAFEKAVKKQIIMAVAEGINSKRSHDSGFASVPVINSGFERAFGTEYQLPWNDTQKLTGHVHDNIVARASQPECTLFANWINKLSTAIAILDSVGAVNQRAGAGRTAEIDATYNSLVKDVVYNLFGDTKIKQPAPSVLPPPLATLDPPPPAYYDPGYTLKNPFSTTPTPGK
ncbi:MAG: hypothetical protein WCW01_05010 [Gammaproteobacteria bacterium]